MAPTSDTQARIAHWEALFQQEKQTKLLQALEEAPKVEVADFLSAKPSPFFFKTFLALDENIQGILFHHFNEQKRMELYNHLSKIAFSKFFQYTSSDVRADFFLQLDRDQRIQLLPYLTRAVRRDVITLSGYSHDQAGGIMHTDFVTLKSQNTIADAIAEVRKVVDLHSNKTLHVLYIIDHQHKLAGVLNLKDLVVEAPETNVMEVANKAFVSVNLEDDREEVARKIEKYDLMFLPVLNNEKQLVGIVNHDDALDVIRAEEKEDMNLFMGIQPTRKELDYVHTSAWQHFRKRIVWVAGLCVIGVFTSLFIHSFEKLLASLSAFIAYIVVISDTGGNVGSQTASLVVRALSLGEISSKDWVRVLKKEIKVALMIAFSLFWICLIKVSLISYLGFTEHQTSFNTSLKIALTVSVAVALQAICSMLIGATFPLIMKRMGKDPALAASPAITTIVDISGMLIYFTLIYLMWSGSQGFS
ncbi:MAG: magnesium transporter [Cytophagales bacterium]